MKNKRIMFPIIVSVVVIVIAIIIFVIIGSGEKNNKSNSTIRLGGNSENVSKSNTVDNTDDEDNTVDNDIDNSTDNSIDNTSNNTTNSVSDDNIDFDGDEFYLEASKAFVKGLMNSDDMNDFVNDYVDVKAYAACFDVNADDAKFMEEYQKLSDDDDKVLSINEKFKELVSEDEFKLDAISNPKTSSDDENISRVTVTLKKENSTEKYRMVFYSNIVIYIADDSGDSIIDLNN